MKGPKQQEELRPEKKWRRWTTRLKRKLEEEKKDDKEGDQEEEKDKILEEGEKKGERGGDNEIVEGNVFIELQSCSPMPLPNKIPCNSLEKTIVKTIRDEIFAGVPRSV